MSRGLLRLRQAIVVAMALVVAVSAGDVFDRRVWSLVILPAAVGVVALLIDRRPWIVRLAGPALTIVGGIGVVVVIEGGDVEDLWAAFGSGYQRLLTTDWPSPDRPDLIATIAGAAGLVTAAAAELARRPSLHLAPLVPLAAAQVGVIALSSARGVQLHWLLPLTALALALAVLRPGQGIDVRERFALLRGERRLVPVVLLAIVVASATALGLVLADRADPRRNEPAVRSATLVDPIEATLALKRIEPPVDLHRIRLLDSTADDPATVVAPTRWRTAALSSYDGRRWSPELTLRPIGRRLGPPADDAVSGTVEFLDDDLRLIPLPGAPITVDADIETDADRTIVRTEDRPGDEPIAFTSSVEPGVTDVDPSDIGARDVDENSLALAELAESFAEQGGAVPDDPLLTRLSAIESTMSDDFVLRSDAPGGGLQRALIERFLRDTQQGNSEQFATGFVLLVRSLGVDARVATGFEVEPARLGSSDDGDALTLASDDALVWPEVRVGERWIAFDPVPETEATDATPPPPEPQVQTPAAPQPPIADPPEQAEQPPVDELDDGDDADGGLPVVVTFALTVAAGVGALLVPILFVVALILGAKWRRRRRRLSGPAPERIRGAWAVATDRLVDAGMDIDRADTNHEIALEARAQAPHVHRELHRLASLASATTFGDPARLDLLAEDASACLGQVEASMAEDRNSWQRARWRLSLRSLRRSTSSPV